MQYILIIIASLIWLSNISKAAELERYEYANGMQIEAPNFKEAAKRCFSVMTNNRYPGEEKGLDIIDVCVNGKRVK